ncbi:MAG: serine/threonine protein kinase [Bacteroidales bacterium]|nr:serine/threonine protein kinase [Bacteroidales bacterium]
MESNSLFHDRYFLERLLGRGNFAEVWLAKDTKTDIMVALKIYAPATGLDDAGLNVFAREFALVVDANHKNLLRPLYYDTCDRKPYLVLPYCQNGSVMRRVGNFTEEDAWRMLRDVASGLAWLHAMNPPVIHQDIKPDNIMLSDSGNYLITDFGVSTHLKSTLRKSMSAAFSSAGTIAYMAPERFSANNTPIMANDIYSLGATVYEMLTGDTPFGDDGGLRQHKGAEVPVLQGPYSDQLKKVIDKCLKTNPWERPTAEQLEKYAETGLEGGQIHFVDEKTFFQKYKWIIIAGIVVVLCGIALGIVAIVRHHKAEEERKALEAIEAADLDVQSAAMALVARGDSLMAVGDVHEEGYETSYVEAYQLMQEAIDSKSQLQGEGATLSVEPKAQSQKQLLEGKLIEAYGAIAKKAALFSDEPEVAADFYDRASKIEAVIAIPDSLKISR